MGSRSRSGSTSISLQHSLRSLDFAIDALRRLLAELPVRLLDGTPKAVHRLDRMLVRLVRVRQPTLEEAAKQPDHRRSRRRSLPSHRSAPRPWDWRISSVRSAMIGGNVSTMAVTWAFSARRSTISFSYRAMSFSMLPVQSRNRTPTAMRRATVSPSGPSSSWGSAHGATRNELGVWRHQEGCRRSWSGGPCPMRAGMRDARKTVAMPPRLNFRGHPK
jgi:hypothetical protein